MKFSLRAKTIILIILIAAILGGAGLILTGQFINRIIDESYENTADGLAHTLSVTIDSESAQKLTEEIFSIYHSIDNKVLSDDWGSPEFDEYISKFSHLEETEEFQSLLKQLRDVQAVNDVDCLYLGAVDPDLKHMIYIVDAAEEDACPPGCIDPLYEENWGLITDPARGFPPYITDTEPYGWLVTAGAAVYNDAGEVVCYSLVDISMEAIRSQQSHFIWLYTIILVALTLIVCIIAILIVNHIIIKPINKLSSAAAHYSREEQDKIDHLEIKTNDEIQSLYTSIKQMTHDINDYIDNLMATTNELVKTRKTSDKMNELAHTDALTGVGNKLAYDQKAEQLSKEMQSGSAQFGIVMVDLNYLKKLNDNYGHEKGDMAIKKISSIICDVFGHSPVYRLGGDEFAVIAEYRDYEDIDDLVKEFKDTVSGAEGQPWEKVDAAIGYAIYNGNETVAEVLRRADRNMYEHKKSMKSKA
mgnify:CR=1 FL=1